MQIELWACIYMVKLRLHGTAPTAVLRAPAYVAMRTPLRSSASWLSPPQGLQDQLTGLCGIEVLEPSGRRDTHAWCAAAVLSSLF